MEMNRYNEIIADSSFYICFLDDINRPEILCKIINEFDFIITPLVKNEIKKSKNYFHLQNNKNIAFIQFSLDYGEILKAFFSKEEIIKGEHEVIGTAYILYRLNRNFCFIIDDSEPRKFVINNIPDLIKLMMGTVNFIGLCCCSYGLLRKNETLMLLNQIEKSKFRVKKTILNQVRLYVGGYKNGS